MRNMQKVAYIIPGYGESYKTKGYSQVASFFKARKIKAVPVKISWKHNTMSDYVDEFMEQCKSRKGHEVYLLGFSFGSMIALMASGKVRPKVIILCSLSPWFKEDLPYLKKSWKRYFGKKKMEDFKRHSFDEFAKQVRCRTILIAGDKESPELDKRVKDAAKKIKNSKFIIIPNAKHDISQKDYLEVLRELISSL